MSSSGNLLSALASDTLLTRDEVAEWLGISPQQVTRLGIPCIDLGHKTKRYLVRDVLAWLERRHKEGARGCL